MKNIRVIQNILGSILRCYQIIRQMYKEFLFMI